MSIQYDKIISSSPKNTLKINITGFQDGVITSDDVKLSLYAYDTSKGSPIFNKTLNFHEVVDIYNYLNSISIIRDNTQASSHKFIELDEQNREIINLISTSDSKFLIKIFEKINNKEKQQLLLHTLSKSQLSSLSASIKQTEHVEALKCLERLLELEMSGDVVKAISKEIGLKGYVAKQPEKIFQKWIEGNLWSLGSEYIKKHPARKIGLNSESDLLMESTDGFIDVIELKRPKALIFAFDESHKSYYPTPDLSKVIGQSLHYLKKLDEYKLVLEKEYKCKVLRPRIKIIIGRTDSFNDEQYEALRMLNGNLSHIEIISYDFLLSCGETITQHYK